MPSPERPTLHFVRDGGKSPPGIHLSGSEVRSGSLMIEVADFLPTDYDEVMALWSATEGLTIRDADSREAITRYLARNPALSFVARDAGNLVGAVLTGTDGRRGYLQHLAVVPSHRGRGVGRALAQRAVDALRTIGIVKCHLMVRQENAEARAFWRHLGWQERADVTLMSYADPNATNP
jgi:ribosomal protein S18 acetylase RimI-like enzyme